MQIRRIALAAALACGAPALLSAQQIPPLPAKPAAKSTPTPTDAAIITQANKIGGVVNGLTTTADMLVTRVNALQAFKDSVVAASKPTTPPPVVVPPVARPGIPLGVGSNLNDSVAKYPAGSVFRLRTGTHLRQSVTVTKANVTVIADSGAVMDGGGTAVYAFQPGGTPADAAGLTLRGFTIQNYNPPAQMGAVRAGGHNAGDGTNRWVLDSMTVTRNATGGVRLGNGIRITASRITYNGQIGLTGIGDGIVVDGNEIAFNNEKGGFDAAWEAGGTKFVLTKDLTVRNNFVHHNNGPGLWTDIDNIRTLFEGNRVEDNAEQGIFQEISRQAVIRNNVVRRNGLVRGSWGFGAGIVVAGSPDVEVYGNTVEGNYNGITGVQQARGAGIYGPHELRNLNVHDNTVTMPSGVTGVVQDVGAADIFTARNIQFRANRYTVPPANAQPFEWQNGRKTYDQWRAVFPTDTVVRP